MAILRYLGNEFNLHGSNNVEKALIDGVVDTSKELHDTSYTVQFATEDKKVCAFFWR